MGVRRKVGCTLNGTHAVDWDMQWCSPKRYTVVSSWVYVYLHRAGRGATDSGRVKAMHWIHSTTIDLKASVLILPLINDWPINRGVYSTILWRVQDTKHLSGVRGQSMREEGAAQREDRKQEVEMKVKRCVVHFQRNANSETHLVCIGHIIRLCRA